MKVGVIIVAGGSGTRMGGNLPKQFLQINGRGILVRTLEKFRMALPQSEIVVSLAEEMMSLWQEILVSENCVSEHKVCEGGSERFFSVKNGLASLGDVDYVMVHDAVRPLLSEDLILQSLESAQKYGAVVPAIDSVDSLREITEQGSRALKRNDIRAVQTPQVFKADILKNAYTQDFDKNFTDDASVVEKMGQKIYLCGGERCNIKITNPLDIKIAELIMEQNEF
ncbi:MAG: 2-C-methyl-D-erythritol 4-phosphate cytidylyltransferase [Rikenellaceae bacterium]